MELKYKLRSVGIPSANGGYRAVVPLSSIDMTEIGLPDEDLRQLEYLFGLARSKILTALMEGKRVNFFDTLTLEPGLSGSVSSPLGTFDNASLEIRAKVKKSLTDALRGSGIDLTRDDTPPAGPRIQGLLSDLAEGFIGFQTLNFQGYFTKGLSYVMTLVNVGNNTGFDLTPYVVKITGTRIIAKIPNLSTIRTALAPYATTSNELLLTMDNVELPRFPVEFGLISGFTPPNPLEAVHLKTCGGFTLSGTAYSFLTNMPSLEFVFSQLDDDSGRFSVVVKVGGQDTIASFTDYIAAQTVGESGFYDVWIPFVDPLPAGYSLPIEVVTGAFAIVSLPRALLSATIVKGQEYSVVYPSISSS